MAKRRKAARLRSRLLWTGAATSGAFIDAVEKFVSTAADLHALVVGQLAELQALQAKQTRRRSRRRPLKSKSLTMGCQHDGTHSRIFQAA